MEVAVAATTIMGASSLRPMSAGLIEVGEPELLSGSLGVVATVSEERFCWSLDGDAGDCGEAGSEDEPESWLTALPRNPSGNWIGRVCFRLKISYSFVNVTCQIHTDGDGSAELDD